MDQKYTNDSFSTIKDLYENLENLAWLTQKTEEKKVIEETLLFPHTEQM